MPLDVADFIGKPRDSVVETALAAQLRALPEDEAFAFVWKYLDADVVVGLVLANRVLRANEHFERLLARGFAEADVSSVRFWIECCLPRLGVKRVWGAVQELAARDPRTARKVIYWAQILLSEAEPSLRAETAALYEKLEKVER